MVYAIIISEIQHYLPPLCGAQWRSISVRIVQRGTKKPLERILIMKRISLSKCLALALTVVMLFSFAPGALADSFYWAPIETRSVVYYATDMKKSYETLDVGQKVKVQDSVTISGQTWLRVWANNEITSGQSIGYMQPSGIPSGIPTTSFQGQVTTTSATSLYCTFNVSSGTMCSVPLGSELKVVRQIGDWYLVQYQTAFYGYVQSSMCSTFTTVAPVVTASQTTSTVSSNTTSGVTTSIKLLSEVVLSKGRIAQGTKLYKTNTLSDTYAYGQIATLGDCNIYYKVDNDFYMVDINGMYAYVPCQSVNVYDTRDGMKTYAGAVDSITVVNPNATAAAASTSTSSTGTVTNCSSWVSMRKKADSKSSRLAKVTKGASVTVLGTSGEYTKITYNGKTGYILSSYIK